MNLAAWLGAGGIGLIAASLLGQRRHLRPVRRLSRSTGALLMVPWIVIQLVTGSLDGYHRLTEEIQAAEIRFEQIDAQQFRAILRLPDGATREIRLAGDEWQIDARILVWRAWADWLGLPTCYRFERISGRYASVEEEREQPRTVHALAENQDSTAWNLLLAEGHRLPAADTTFGTAAYLPMADDARYVVSVSRTGLLARPDNDEAERAVHIWNRTSP